MYRALYADRIKELTTELQQRDATIALLEGALSALDMRLKSAEQEAVNVEAAHQATLQHVDQLDRRLDELNEIVQSVDVKEKDESLQHNAELEPQNEDREQTGNRAEAENRMYDKPRSICLNKNDILAQGDDPVQHDNRMDNNTEPPCKPGAAEDDMSGLNTLLKDVEGMQVSSAEDNDIGRRRAGPLVDTDLLDFDKLFNEAQQSINQNINEVKR